MSLTKKEPASGGFFKKGIYGVATRFVLLRMVNATGNKITINTALKAIAGSTAKENMPTNAPGNPTIKYAEVRNMVPETRVPTDVNTAALTTEPRYFLKTINSPKKIKAVSSLSIMFGI